MNTSKASAESELNRLGNDNYYDFKANRSDRLSGVWSKSELHYAAHSPHKWFAGLSKYQTSAMGFGNVVDTLMTEPGKFAERYFVTDHEDGRLKPYREDKAIAVDQGLQILKRSEVEQAESMISSLQSHRICSVVSRAQHAQKPMTAVFELNGPAGVAFVAFKCKADFVLDHGDGTVSIYDLKTTGMTTDSDLVRVSRTLGYHWQEFLYTKIYEANGIGVREFGFPFVSTEAPYRCRYVEMSDEALTGAAVSILRALSMVYAMGTGGRPEDTETAKLVMGSVGEKRDYWNTVPELNVPQIEIKWM